MPILNKRTFEKKEPFRDATLFLIVCEGGKREPDYFRFFEGISSKLNIIVVQSTDGKSAPNHLLDNAKKSVEKINTDEGDFELWFVLDMDRWGNHIHALNNECSTKNGKWKIALSNPCFEVWLYYHFRSEKPLADIIQTCNVWKALVNTVVNGGFNSSRHPIFVSDAILSSKNNYSATGYLPDLGSTDLHILGAKIYDLTNNIIDKFSKTN